MKKQPKAAPTAPAPDVAQSTRSRVEEVKALLRARKLPAEILTKEPDMTHKSQSFLSRALSALRAELRSLWSAIA